jgi:regulatory protein
VARSDGSLAPVTYLFGQAPVEDSEPVDGPAPVDPSEPPAPLTSTRRRRPATASEAEPQWATPGVDHVADAEPVAMAPLVPTEPTREERRAHNVGLNALTRKGQSVAEMQKLLESRELDEETIAAEIKRLKSVGLLDDFELADTLVRTLSERKGLGTSAIKSELRQRKISQVAIDAALVQLDGDDELNRAIEIAVKRAGQLSSYDQATAKRRLGAFLQRRGYSGSILSAAMAAALDSTPRSGSGPRFE